MNAGATTPMRFAGRTWKETRHICAFFNSREDQNKVLMPFFKLKECQRNKNQGPCG